MSWGKNTCGNSGLVPWSLQDAKSIKKLPVEVWSLTFFFPERILGGCQNLLWKKTAICFFFQPPKIGSRDERRVSKRCETWRGRWMDSYSSSRLCTMRLPFAFFFQKQVPHGTYRHSPAIKGIWSKENMHPHACNKDVLSRGWLMIYFKTFYTNVCNYNRCNQERLGGEKDSRKIMQFLLTSPFVWAQKYPQISRLLSFTPQPCWRLDLPPRITQLTGCRCSCKDHRIFDPHGIFILQGWREKSWSSETWHGKWIAKKRSCDDVTF